MLTVYPWQRPQWENLLSVWSNNRLPHALLLTGPEGIGHAHFANCLAAVLLCQKPDADGHACGQCKSCILFRAGNHPDLIRIEPEQSGKQLKVEFIRELIDYIHLTSQYGRYKIAILNPADAMNRSASNSLLKTLEEPPAGSLIILITHQPSLLPITIRSRCQRLDLSFADGQIILQWLKEQTGHTETDLLAALNFARGCPLKAMEILESERLNSYTAVMEDLRLLRKQQIGPVKTAEKWQNIGITEVLSCLLSFFSDMARLKLDVKYADNNKSSINRDLQHLTNGLDLAQLIQCYDLALHNYFAATGPISLNKQGLLEEIIICWQTLTVRNGR